MPHSVWALPIVGERRRMTDNLWDFDSENGSGIRMGPRARAGYGRRTARLPLATDFHLALSFPSAPRQIRDILLERTY